MRELSPYSEEEEKEYNEDIEVDERALSNAFENFSYAELKEKR